MLKTDIDAGRPIIYAAVDQSDYRHIWVIDGYNSTNEFYCNWGWGGRFNGFYPLSLLNPDIFLFSYDHQAIFGIRPILDACSGLAGSDIVCSNDNESYSVTIPSSASVIWTKSTNLNQVSGNTGTTYIVTANSSASGLGTITATVKNSQGQTFLARSKSVWAGTPSPNELDITNSNYYPQKILVAGEINVLWVDVSQEGSFAGIADYDWDFNSGWTHWEQESNDMVSVVWVPPFSGGYETIFVRGENTCGEGNWHYETFEVVQNYYFSIYPNPASDYIELSIESGNEVQDKTSKVKIENVKGRDGLGEYTLEIWSEKGGRLKTLKSKEMCQQISTRDLPTGKYFVHLLIGDKVYKQQLIVAK